MTSAKIKYIIVIKPHSYLHQNSSSFFFAGQTEVSVSNLFMCSLKKKKKKKKYI